MRCLSLAIVLTGLLFATATIAKDGGESYTRKWKRLSQLNDPPNQPSIRAAKAATQGLSRQQIKDQHFRLVMLYRQASAHANGDALKILRREILLLQIAGAD